MNQRFVCHLQWTRTMTPYLVDEHLQLLLFLLSHARYMQRVAKRSQVPHAAAVSPHSLSNHNPRQIPRSKLQAMSCCRQRCPSGWQIDRPSSSPRQGRQKKPRRTLAHLRGCKLGPPTFKLMKSFAGTAQEVPSTRLSLRLRQQLVHSKRKMTWPNTSLGYCDGCLTPSSPLTPSLSYPSVFPFLSFLPSVRPSLIRTHPSEPKAFLMAESIRLPMGLPATDPEVSTTITAKKDPASSTDIRKAAYKSSDA